MNRWPTENKGSTPSGPSPDSNSSKSNLKYLKAVTTLDQARAEQLSNLIQRLGAEIPIEPELLILVDQALTHVSSGRARNLERLEFPW